MKRISVWTRTVTIMALTLALMTSVALAGKKSVLWESAEGSVALVPRETGGSVPAAPNDHPVNLAVDQITAMLGTVEVRETATDSPEDLFTEGSLRLIAPHLSRALQRATPDDDVSFVVVGLYKTPVGLNQAQLSSGRIFYKNGKLNLILGVSRQELRYRADGSDRDFRLLATGSRNDTAPGEWALLPRDDRTVDLTRKDWIVIDPRAARAAKTTPSAPSVLPAASQPAKKGVGDRSLPERLATLAALKEKGLITDDEYRDRRREIMAEQEQERAPAERLMILNELKQKGLVSDEEYRTRRLQILKDL